MTWEIVIGLEVHTQLSTRTKIFSGASTTYGAEPNTQADAVSIALPGVLPVLNKGAVERAVKFGLAVGAHIAPRSVFARKNYFYPDLPKGYQISQFDLPVVGMGSLAIQVEPLSGNAKPYEKVVRITRAHLEEDAGKSVHGASQGMTGVDLNRAGTPLLEIVSEPDMCSAAEAVAYAKTLHNLVRWIGISDGNMQEGSFRCDVNVSVRRPGEELGTRREIKNLNSFKYMQQAIDYEVQWQIDTLENGGKIHQATILFNPDTGETRAMRSKEDAHDYRYFPDPDLLPLDITPEMLAAMRTELPELPEARRTRYVNELGLSAYDAASLTSSREMADYFDTCVTSVGNAKLCANWLIGELSAQLNRDGLDMAQCPVSPQQMSGMLVRIADNTISNAGAKEVFRTLWAEGGDADLIIDSKGLKQVSDSGAIEALVDEIITANADKVAEYRSGKDKLFGFFVGLAMKASKGKANPAQLNEVLLKKLAG
ncbi:MAG TPA: Asp-tRNA(Asn)/Glu-tRNA(Gln) amidotransferase GatCAB subunit B [Gallionella sp.]|jgi:aspartyl-tRNA(Asn)/glutamyl-tRNA(Gln) amidotransferase subunit B|nr:MAG: aspartyl/glutamyl-tRNA amidotransferase subunit B [Gallionellales bacterium GWA2_54_124]OGT19130.1 MAG: aspartyl/glutamyl-tRNA amidotransferase subunit B [Gallionellales bacterium RIFOXYD12_FULL_53_10]HCI53942.1 Asp-tRNA(Asn)/Glu-tRNA(Gln) amidotransferase GatCAB subunit B [Gallionella sp.]